MEHDFFDIIDELRVELTTTGVNKSTLDEASILWDTEVVDRINNAVAPLRMRPIPSDRVFILYDVKNANYLVLNNKQQHLLWFGG